MSGVRIPPPRPTPSGDATRKVLTFGSVRQTLCLRFLMVAVVHQVEHRIVAPEVVGSRPVSHPISLLTPTQIETTMAQAISREMSGFDRESVLFTPNT